MCSNRKKSDPAKEIPEDGNTIVVEGDTMVGIITSGDILAYQFDEHEATIQHLNSYFFNLR